MTGAPQQGRPTVGDTMTVVHRVAAPAGAVVQARAPLDSTIATLLGAPIVTREGDSVRIAYPMTVWAPGRSELVIPGPVVVTPDGAIDTLPDARIVLDVASVLPAEQRPATIAPKPVRPWVVRADRTAMPLLFALALLLLVAGLGRWWWRRRGPVRLPHPPVEAPPPSAERHRAWVEAGEGRLALEHLQALARGREEFADWNARAEAVRFAAGGEAELAALVDEGWRRLGAGAA